MRSFLVMLLPAMSVLASGVARADTTDTSQSQTSSKTTVVDTHDPNNPDSGGTKVEANSHGATVSHEGRTDDPDDPLNRVGKGAEHLGQQIWHGAEHVAEEMGHLFGR
jgi:hypothetical protein